LDNELRNQYNERLNKASENVLETMEDLLLWSKSQMKNFVPQYKPVKIVSLLEQEIQLFDEQVREKELRVNVNVSHEASYHTDENFIGVILRNLIQNAIKQCNKKDVITIDADKDKISITNPAGDTQAEELNLLMHETNISSKRSGLGLHIVNDLATRLGIKIYFLQKDSANIAATISWI
jgi:signal transduction histidine kinase